MNDAGIRRNLHCKKLRRHHVDPDTLVVDELGLKHGKCRADIAVINGHLMGYEIKSDDDSLRRLAGHSHRNGFRNRLRVLSRCVECIGVT